MGFDYLSEWHFKCLLKAVYDQVFVYNSSREVPQKQMMQLYLSICPILDGVLYGRGLNQNAKKRSHIFAMRATK